MAFLALHGHWGGIFFPTKVTAILSFFDFSEQNKKYCRTNFTTTQQYIPALKSE